MKKKTRKTKLIHLRGTRQVSKLIKRESGIAFKKGIREPLLTELVVFINRYIFYGGFLAVEYRPVQMRHVKPIVYSE